MNRTSLVAIAFAGLAVPLAPVSAQAQTDPQAALRDARAQCMELSTDAERLACLNAALDRMDRALETQPVPAAQPPAPPPVTDMGAEQVAARQSGRAAQESQQRDESLHAAIVAAREPVPGQMVLELDNGQVWRQIDGDARGLHFASGSTPVEITRSRLGGYRMTLLDQRQMLRVERIR